jgi:D-alanine transaminase
VLVYLNGKYLPREEATISVEDRGFLFADGVYEVVRIVDGRPHLLREHLERLEAGLGAIRIELAEVEGLGEVATRLIEENSLREGDAIFYLQVTRGAAPRKHAFPPAGTTPTVFAFARPYTPHPEAHYLEGVATITVPDIRWARCDIKSIALLPNVLANQQAHEAGAHEALFVRDGVVLEGSQSNLFGVFDGVLVTYPRCNYILPGITRQLVLGLAGRLGIPTREEPIRLDQLREADELFLTGTTTEVMPITTVDGRRIGGGAPGPITRSLLEAYREEL